MTCKTLIIASLLANLFEARIRERNLTDFPYLAMIGTFTDQNLRFTSACTGSILTRRYILTTAHCFRLEENWIALIGANPKEKTAAVLEKWILHPHYTVTVDITYNDVALTVTEKFIDFEKLSLQPISFTPLNPNVLQHDLICRMVGWQFTEPENLTADVTSPDFATQAQNLAKIYSVEKKFLSPKQCQSLVNLVPDLSMVIDSSFLCVKHFIDFVDESEYGFVGSPLLCKEDEHDTEWALLGLKLRERNIENGVPELFVNLHRFHEYVHNTIKNPNVDPLKYFCLIKVCDKKYIVAGEYCLVGDIEDCYYRGYSRKLHFPFKSHCIKHYKSSSNICSFMLFISFILNMIKYVVVFFTKIDYVDAEY